MPPNSTTPCKPSPTPSAPNSPPADPAGPEGCIVAIDPGERWIGVARTAPGSDTALPVGTIDLRASRDEGRSELARMLDGLQLAQLVTGLPVRPDGEEDEQALRFKAQGEVLARHLGIPCCTQEERDTSAPALLQERPRTGKARRPGARSKQRRRKEQPREHAQAAARILQRWLDQRSAAR